MSAMHDLPPPGVSAHTVTDARGAQPVVRQDWLADEVPVALVFNDISHAVMMASPGDLEDFALGFGLTEGLLDAADELYSVDVVEVTAGIELRLHVASACAWRLRERRRTLAGRTGCGLCGTDSLDQVRRTLTDAPALAVPASVVSQALDGLRAAQTMGQLTGATHAAAWFDTEGRLCAIREDVGRHNALDKLIGHLVRQRVDPAQGFVGITSRASFEMVQKTLVFGAGLLAAVSAPTSLAVTLAQSHQLALAGYVRERGLVAYSFAERLVGAAHASTKESGHGRS